MFTALHNLLIHFSILFLGSVDNVAPSAAAPGAPIVINGSGFGLSKPKVTLIPGDGSKPISLKVTTFSDTSITASFTKGPAGNYTLQVQPKGKGVAPMDAPAPFQISAPTDGIVAPNKADATMIVTLSANHLGPKKGTITVGGFKAKIVTWNPLANPVTSDSAPQGTVTFQLHKNTPPGLQPVVVRTAAGDATVNGFTVLSSGNGNDQNPFSSTLLGLSFLVDGNPAPLFSAPTYTLFPQTHTNYRLKTQGNDISFFNIYFSYNLAKANLTAPKVHIVWQGLSSVYATTGNPFTGETLPGASVNFKINDIKPIINSTAIGGSFTATLVKVMGAGPETIQITDGYYWGYAANF